MQAVRTMPGPLLTAPLSGHQVMINGHALRPPLSFVRNCDRCRPGTAVETARSELRTNDLDRRQSVELPGRGQLRHATSPRAWAPARAVPPDMANAIIHRAGLGKLRRLPFLLVTVSRTDGLPSVRLLCVPSIERPCWSNRRGRFARAGMVSGLVASIRIRSLQIRTASSAAAGWPWLATPGGWFCVIPAMFASRCLPAVPRGPANVPGATAARQNGETAE
jgi:hypothetical protein